MKSILIHLTDGNGLAPAVSAGLVLASRFNAKAFGLYAIPSLATTFWGTETAEFLPTLENQLRKTADTALARFKEMTSTVSIPIESRIIDNAYLSTFSEVSFGYDLLVTTQLKSSPETMAEMEFQAADIVVGVSCPTLVVPQSFQSRPIGDHVVIAWNNSRESSRAVRDSLPLLLKAKSVVVLHVTPVQHEPVATGAIVEFLNNHGVPHVLVSRQAPTASVTKTIQDAVAEYNADLLVMGAWGHSRLRELILGGVTREILDHMTIPVLMSH
jgi:nucleotide-binding universal stress UspA family protein